MQLHTWTCFQLLSFPWICTGWRVSVGHGLVSSRCSKLSNTEHFLGLGGGGGLLWLHDSSVHTLVSCALQHFILVTRDTAICLQICGKYDLTSWIICSLLLQISPQPFYRTIRYSAWCHTFTILMTRQIRSFSVKTAGRITGICHFVITNARIILFQGLHYFTIWVLTHRTSLLIWLSDKFEKYIAYPAPLAGICFC